MDRYGENKGRWVGIVLTVLAHAVAVVAVSFTGIKYLYPPPAETAMLLEFEQEKEIVVERSRGTRPRSEEPDRTRPVELVQQSKSPEVADRENLTPESKPDDFGDVPVQEPERKEEPKLDPRASFPGMAKKDTTLTAAHASDKSSDTFKAGQSNGNTLNGRTDGKPNAHLKGRNVLGNIPRPSYTVQESGIVVVSIWVDQYGTVQKAVPGSDGTTVTDMTLWAAARKAAMETHFNMSAEAPAMQEGTITYIFSLK